MAMASSSSTMRGSSPRGRGKPSVRLRKCTPRGLIPAWAGKTKAARLCAKNDRAHPRVGGENSSHALATSSASGSSPRGRGKRRRHRRRGGARGLIPAWAGKTAIVSLISKPASAHPRVGGENRLGVATRISKQGSSPRGRGKHELRYRLTPEDRLIPAWAGKTTRRRRPLLTGWAHPRVGGENRDIMREMPADHGSSPRGRGKPNRQAGRLPAGRLIPAWAGKTSSHPTAFTPSRLIPAWAGKT